MKKLIVSLSLLLASYTYLIAQDEEVAFPYITVNYEQSSFNPSRLNEFHTTFNRFWEDEIT